MRCKAMLGVALLLSGILLVSTAPAPALDLGKIVTVFGIGYAVRVYGDQINSFINKLLAERGVEWEGTTKVVPIISIGSGIYVGAAQVAGPPSLVTKVKAIAQGEIQFGSNFRGKALIPIGSTGVKGKLNRIEGVGLSALIDFRI